MTKTPMLLLTSKLSALLGVMAVVALSSCSPNKDAGAYIALSVSPDKPFIVPGKGSSCVALTAARAAGTDTVEADVAANRIKYESFRLQWRSLDALTIVGLRATVTGVGIDGSYVQDFSEDEMKALFGLTTLTVAATTVTTARPIDIVSNDSQTTKPVSGTYAPCALHIGGIKIKDTVKAFTAQVKIELVGFSTAADGTQAPVRKSVTARAELF